MESVRYLYLLFEVYICKNFEVMKFLAQKMFAEESFSFSRENYSMKKRPMRIRHFLMVQLLTINCEINKFHAYSIDSFIVYNVLCSDSVYNFAYLLLLQVFLRNQL